MSLHEFLHRNVKKMVHNIGEYDRGNIYSLVVSEIERSLISMVLEELNDNYVRAAKVLGISRSRLYRKVEALGLCSSSKKKHTIKKGR